MAEVTARKRPATLLGTGIGDALGCPFEVADKAPLAHPRLAGWDGRFLAACGGWHDLDAGQWSDDTQFSMALAGAIVDEPNLDPVKVAAAYLKLFHQTVRGMGSTTKEAMRALEAGKSAYASGVHGAEGNGPAMRASPIGLRFRRLSLPVVMNFARTDARITHVSAEAMEGSAAVAGMVALLAEESSSALKRRLLGDVVYYLHASKVKDRLRQLLVEMQSKRLPQLLRDFGTRGHIVQTVPSAFACFMMTESYEDAVLSAVRAGGDADTTAAVAGALAGTHYGKNAVERAFEGAWAREVEQSDMLSTLDEQLFAAGEKDATTKASVEGEAR